MSSESIKVPDLGGADNVEVIELCVTVGDQVEEGQSLIVVESDKASMDIPSPLAGKVTSIVVNEGAEVSTGDVIVELDVAGESSVSSSDQAKASDQAKVSADNPIAEPQPEPTPTPEPVSQGALAVTSTETVRVPELGGADSVELIELLVSVGDEVAVGDGLMALESDKASMDLPAPVAGKVTALLVDVGATLTVGMPIAEIESVSSTMDEQPQLATQSSAPDAITEPVAETSIVEQPAVQVSNTSSTLPAAQRVDSQPPSQSTSVYAGPAVRKLARELGVSLEQVSGSGPKGRISKEDLHAYVRDAVSSREATGGNTGAGMGVPPVPAVDFSQFGEVDIQPMSKMHRVTAANMHRSWLNVPHVTQFDDADITELEIFRKSLKPEMEKRGVRMSPVPFIIKAVAKALVENPMLNASLGEDGQSMVYKQYVHVGMAVDTPAGLLVPVIRDVDQKGIWDIAAEVQALAELAKARKLTPAQMQGGCFTVSSLGGIGGQGFTPIVNTPEVGILGVSRLQTKPEFIGGEFVPRQMLPLSLSYDHRAVNGGDAGRFLTAIVSYLAEVRRMLL